MNQFPALGKVKEGIKGSPLNFIGV